jgi:DNA-binding CsgD family transcriptional regulator
VAEDALARATVFGAAGPLAAAQVTSMLARAGEPAATVPAIRTAAGALAPTPLRLEHARALTALGAAELAAGRASDARATLRAARERAHLCGASALERSALARLRAAGGRPRRARLHGPGALTPREREIATLAADGLPNREIADRLYVTVRTVEFHLAGAYRKLGVGGRAALAAALE